MTVEERARDLAESARYVLPPICDGVTVVAERLVPLLSAGIRAVIAEEREACARVVETVNGITRADVAAAIRARGAA